MTRALVIGGGPAGLAACDALLTAGHEVLLAEAKPSLGRKFLMAGKSGLNLTKAEAFEPFVSHYAEAAEQLRPMLTGFDPAAVQAWAEGLGQKTFVGSTGRVFPNVMKASPLLRAWLARLDQMGLQRRTRWSWTGWDEGKAAFHTPDGVQSIDAEATVLALGGASWARLGSDGAWAETLAAQGIALAPFAPSNAGLRVAWSAHMTPLFGQPLKSIRMQSGTLSSRGEVTLSARGLEGGGLYALTPALRRGAELRIDLLPDVAVSDVLRRLSRPRGKDSMSTFLRKALRMDKVKIALLNELVRPLPEELDLFSQTLKGLRIPHDGLRPMDEAISTAGGVPFEALTQDLMLTQMPGVFCAGEMLDWEAPTGGYLLTACLATGFWAGRGAAGYLAAAA